jgi:purine-binding chemotaxis protein CheW
MDVLVFDLAGWRYALPISVISELVRAVTIVPLPDAPPIVEGLINLRGRLVPVLDIRSRFGLPAQPLSPHDHLLIVHDDARLVAFRVERAQALLQLEPTDIEATAALVPRADQIRGVARLPDGLVLIQDVSAFLRDAETAALDAAMAKAATPKGIA